MQRQRGGGYCNLCDCAANAACNTKPLLGSRGRRLTFSSVLLDASSCDFIGLAPRPAIESLKAEKLFAWRDLETPRLAETQAYTIREAESDRKVSGPRCSIARRGAA